MTEEEARAWIADRFGVSRETVIAQFVDMVIAESPNQNLLSMSSMAAIWRRHVVDSAQLMSLASNPSGSWIDIGTGAGFPGVIAGLLRDGEVLLIEPRRRRAEFLESAVRALGIGGRVRVVQKRAEQVKARAGIISARAVAALPELLAAAAHLADKDTIWLLPKGRSAMEEVVAAQQTWHGSFHVEHSITEPGSLIIIAKGVARR